ncbi:MAG: AMP-binding protein, partial [bacterium]|nr:AMP-binding protein [bacterium]
MTARLNEGPTEVSRQPRPASRSAGNDGVAATCNVAHHLGIMAERVPDQRALILPSPGARGKRGGYVALTFRELEAHANRYANGLSSHGLERGTRVLVMVRPGLEFIGLIFALFKMGAVPILIDPGMGAGRLLDCIRQVRPEAFIGIPLAHVVRVLRRAPFASVKQVVTVGRRWFWGGATLSGLAAQASEQYAVQTTQADETAAILFTSGSTGPAKGVVYTHGMFDAQVLAIRDQYGIKPGEVDLAAFPLFALFGD